ncbi:MAG: GtrA family protein [Chloroflexota bacterium]
MAHLTTGPSSFLRAFVRLRIFRFALVGGIGVPINLALLWFFHGVLRMPIIPAWICAFEPSSLLNFYLNQRFTYREQTHLRGWDWPVRALKAQATSLTGQVVNVMVFAALLALHVHYLPADTAGIATSCMVNFGIANQFVFTAAQRPARAAASRSAEFEGVA